MTFTDRLRSLQEDRRSLLCIGLDTDPAKLPAAVMSAPDPVVAFNRQVIEATHDLVCAYKLNLAFYEALGERGWHTLRETLAGDSAGCHHDCRWQAGRYRQLFRAVCAIADHRTPVRCIHRPSVYGVRFHRTIPSPSGPRRVCSGTHVQSRREGLSIPQSGRQAAVRTCDRPGEKVEHAQQSRSCRRRDPSCPAETHSFARSGYAVVDPRRGCPGGGPETGCGYGCDSRGFLGIINAGRSVLYASSGADFAAAARQAAQTMREEINRYRVTSA